MTSQSTDELKECRFCGSTDPQPAIPPGYAVVPLIPTRAMQDAWDTAGQHEDLDEEFAKAYRAMLASAPAIQPQAVMPAGDRDAIIQECIEACNKPFESFNFAYKEFGGKLDSYYYRAEGAGACVKELEAMLAAPEQAESEEGKS